MNLEDFELPLEVPVEQTQDIVTGEVTNKTPEPMEHIETNEIQRGDFVLVVTPGRFQLNRNAVIGRLEKVVKGLRPEDFKEVLLPIVVYNKHEELIGPIEEKIDNGYSFYKCNMNEDGTILLLPITKLTEKQK